MSLGSNIQLGWYWFAVWACRMFCSVFFNIRIRGRRNVPDKGPFVLVSNHQCWFDPLFAGMHLRRELYLIGRRSLFTNPFLSALMHSMNAIPVRRGEADFGAIRNILAKLQQGKGVCLFPEATRTPDGRIAAFKPGFGLLCKRSNAAVIPVLIEGAFECWPRHKRFFVPGSRIVVEYGKAISPEDIEKMSDKELADRLTNEVRQMQNQCRIRLGREPFEY